MADPISAAVSAIVAVGTKAGIAVGLSKGAALAATTFALKAVAYTALSVAGAALFAPAVDGYGGSPSEWRADPDAGLPFVVGEFGMAGNVVYPSDGYGADNRFTSIVSVYHCNGPVHEWGALTLDEVSATFTSGVLSSGPSLWQGNIYLDRKDGYSTDTALASPAGLEGSATVPGWGSSYRLPGMACSMITLRGDTKNKRFPTGEPSPFQKLKAPKWSYDPRLDSTYAGGSGSHRRTDRSTWGYSDNPYIQALNFALGYWTGTGLGDGTLVGGFGNDWDNVDAAAFVAGANIADTNEWKIGGVFRSTDDKHQVLKAMLQAGGGIYANPAGKISCVCRGAPKTSVATVTYEDLAGDIEIATDAPVADKINSVIPRCPLATFKYEMTPLDEVSVSQYVTDDRGKRQRRIDMPFVPAAKQGTQLAAYAIVNSREPVTGRVPLQPWMGELQLGDCFDFETPGIDLDSVKVIVLDREWNPERQIWTVTFQSETDAKHTYALGLDPTPPSPSGLTPGSAFTIPVPDGSEWTVTGGAVGTDGGAEQPAVFVEGGSEPAMVDGVWIEYALDEDDEPGDWVTWYKGEPSDAQYVITGLDAEQSYWLGIRYRNAYGVWSDTDDRLVLGPYTTGDMVATDATAPSSAISDAVAAINTAQGRADTTLAEATQALAEAAETSLQDSLLNWIEDPTGSDGWLAADGGFIIGKTVGFKALWTPLDNGEQTTKVLWFPAEKNVAPGVLVQAGVEIAVEGAVSGVALEAVWFDSSGSVLSTDELDSGSSGRLSGVETAPASAASVRFRLVPTASSEADGVVAVSEPLAAFGRPDQATADDYQDPASEVVSRFVSIERSLGSMAGSVRQALTENRRARASITSTMATQVGQDEALAALKTELLTTVAGTYLSQASAAITYATISYTDSSISTLQTTLNASIADVSADVTVNAGAIANIEDGAAYFSVAVEASGGNPAIYEMLAGKDGSSITLGGDAIYMFTTVGGTSVKTLELVSGDIYTANDVYVGNDLIVATTGAIMGGATGYMTGTGFYLGYDSSAYKLAVGDPSGQHMAWDGSTLAITGDITRSFGTSGALTIGDLGSSRTGFEILNSSGVEAFYVDDTGEMRLNGDALPTTRSGTEPASPAPGEWWFDTSDDTQYRWNGSTWDGWGTIGGTWGDNIAGRPANLIALVGSEGIENTEISVAADGTLSGAGGGQVTISGLGYTGDLDATVGAAWGSNVTGRPTELTDGRIDAALDASGDLKRPIQEALADSSDLLRYSGGGAFFGDLDATAGATWGGDIASIPSNLSSLSGSEGILNSAVSIAADGTLSGAGGGQVTLAGVGFTGDTNATYGAAWGSTVTGRPTELTDGRVAAGLDASGDLNRNISSARLDSSNALRRTGGGLFSGALNANYITNTNELTDGAGLGDTAAWGSVSSRPTELTDGRISTALDASGILQTAISTTVANSSNLLRYTGGGAFTGALNANYITNTNELTDGANLGGTAAWSGVTSRPTELTDGRIATALDASGILQTNIANASQIPTLTLSKVSDAGALAAKATIDSASLLDSGVVETAKLAANSVTNIATGDGTIYHATETAIVNEEEMARATIEGLTSGAPVVIDVVSAFSEPLGAQYFALKSNGGATANRDIAIRIIRDPDGTPVELISTILKANENTVQSVYEFSGYIRKIVDSAHGGGDVDYAVVMTGFNPGTSTKNSFTLHCSEILTEMVLFETKR